MTTKIYCDFCGKELDTMRGYYRLISHGAQSIKFAGKDVCSNCLDIIQTKGKNDNESKT